MYNLIISWKKRHKKELANVQPKFSKFSKFLLSIFFQMHPRRTGGWSKPQHLLFPNKFQVYREIILEPIGYQLSEWQRKATTETNTQSKVQAQIHQVIYEHGTDTIALATSGILFQQIQRWKPQTIRNERMFKTIKN